MRMRGLVLCLLAVYLTCFVVVLVGTEAWTGGEAAIAWTLLMLLLSAPSGTLVITAQTLASGAWGDQTWFQQFSQLPFGTAVLTIVYAAVGTFQWFVLVPYLVRQVKRLILRVRARANP